MLNFIGNPLLLQYVAVITANLSLLVAGMGLVWPSPVLGQLTSENQTILPRPITEQEGAWIVAVPFLSGMCGIVFSSYLADAIGRKHCVVLSCVPRILIACMYLFAKEFWVILLGRIISGSLDTMAYGTVSTYASEMANKEIRGSLGTIVQTVSSIGILLTLGIGPFVSYTTFNVILTCVSVACSIPLMFLPETPYFLYSKGKTADAHKLLTKLRGSEILANEEIKEYQVASQTPGKVTFTDLIKNKMFLKACVIAIFLLVCSQSNGYTAVTFYLQPTLERTDTTVSPEIASLVVGTIQLVASICTSFISDKFGRKTILIVTTIGVTIGLIGLGAFFKIQENQDITGFMNYLPLVSIILIVYCHSAGLSSIQWVLIGEVFEGRTRVIGTSTGIFFGFLTGFVVTLTLPSLLSYIGPAFTYWMSGVICMLLCVFTAVIVPETKGKSFVEIQYMLGKKSSIDEGKI